MRILYLKTTGQPQEFHHLIDIREALGSGRYTDQPPLRPAPAIPDPATVNEPVGEGEAPESEETKKPRRKAQAATRIDQITGE